MEQDPCKGRRWNAGEGGAIVVKREIVQRRTKRIMFVEFKNVHR